MWMASETSGRATDWDNFHVNLFSAWTRASYALFILWNSDFFLVRTYILYYLEHRLNFKWVKASYEDVRTVQNSQFRSSSQHIVYPSLSELNSRNANELVVYLSRSNSLKYDYEIKPHSQLEKNVHFKSITVAREARVNTKCSTGSYEQILF